MLGVRATAIMPAPASTTLSRHIRGTEKVMTKLTKITMYTEILVMARAQEVY